MDGAVRGSTPDNKQLPPAFAMLTPVNHGPKAYREDEQYCGDDGCGRPTGVVVGPRRQLRTLSDMRRPP